MSSLISGGCKWVLKVCGTLSSSSLPDLIYCLASVFAHISCPGVIVTPWWNSSSLVVVLVLLSIKVSLRLLTNLSSILHWGDYVNLTACSRRMIRAYISLVFAYNNFDWLSVNVLCYSVCNMDYTLGISLCHRIMIRNGAERRCLNDAIGVNLSIGGKLVAVTSSLVPLWTPHLHHLPFSITFKIIASVAVFCMHGVSVGA